MPGCRRPNRGSLAFLIQRWSTTLQGGMHVHVEWPGIATLQRGMVVSPPGPPGSRSIRAIRGRLL